jgi:hypothetical protein
MRNIKFNLAILGLLLSLSAFVNIAQATLITNTGPEGEIQSISNVDINGTLFDVTFSDNSCASIFNGCDATSDFQFATNSEALDALTSLLNQILSDPVVSSLVFNNARGPFGFDDCNGCFLVIPATVIPTSLFQVNDVFGATATVSLLQSGFAAGVDPTTNVAQNSSESRLFATTSADENLFNDRFLTFTAVQVADVPEPSTLAILALGLLGFSMRRQVHK